MTATVTEPPAAVTASVVRSSENTQFGGGTVADDWVNVIVWPATHKRGAPRFASRWRQLGG